MTGIQKIEQFSTQVQGIHKTKQLLYSLNSSFQNQTYISLVLVPFFDSSNKFLKKPEFNREPLLPKFRVPEPFHEPILKAEPAVSVMRIQPEDQFLVFASDGLYEQLSNQEVVDIVKNKPRNGIARRLVKAAVSEAAKRRELRHSDLENISPGIRRHFHDDITVIVVFLDQFLINNGGSPSFELPFSIKGRTGNDTTLLVNEL